MRDGLEVGGDRNTIMIYRGVYFISALGCFGFMRFKA
jgi:hypothetical protein